MSSPIPIDPHAAHSLRACIGKVATGPEYSKDLSFDETYAAMRYILEGKADPVQSGVFLIALRMKRETDAENAGALRAIMDMTNTATAAVDELVDIADPYDGYTRCLPVSPFLPAVLAACGVPTVSHGTETVAPKNGATHRKVLRAAGIDVDLDVQQAAERIGDPGAGWAYIDQRFFCPALYKLADLRDLIVKRPVVSTVENLTSPIRGRGRTRLVTGYVHKAYPPVYGRLARAAGFASAALVRGVEGGVLPSLRQAGKVYEFSDGGDMRLREVNPADVDIHCTARALPLPESLNIESPNGDIAPIIDVDGIARAAAAAGLDALDGAPGMARASLVYGGAIVLTHLGRYEDLRTAAMAVRGALDTGAARTRFHGP
jgi:anthranilate phosphoribosyltransferase